MEINELNFNDKEYPNLLKKIKNPPKRLRVLGDINILNIPGIAIIGSRNCSEEGKKIARAFAKSLASVDVCINSGMAKGIDTEAHIGALDEGGKTIAVLGCGLNHIFPKENKELFYRIIENGGAVISEYEDDEYAESRKFIERNRIVSGLSIGVFVVEAASRSGTSITARYAKEEGKPIFCIPHDITYRLGVGTNKLLEKGAKCVLNAKDILNEYNEFKDKNIETNKSIKKVDVNINEISKEYQQIYKALTYEPISIELISKKTRLNINELNAGLAILELEGYIKREPGNMYYKI